MIDSRSEIKTNFQKPAGRSLDASQLPSGALNGNQLIFGRSMSTGRKTLNADIKTLSILLSC